MKKQVFFRLSISLLVVVQIWLTYVTFSHPYLGVLVTENSRGEWIIGKLEQGSTSLLMNLQVGDRLIEVDGRPAAEHGTIRKWKAVEQAESLVVERNGQLLPVDAGHRKVYVGTDFYPVIGEALCLSLAIVLYRKAGNSSSARYLSLVFVNIGVIFASFGASVRGDTLGKFLIYSLMLLLPIVFLHFLVVFMKEKGQIQFPSNYLRYLYFIVGVLVCPALCYLVPDLTGYFYQLSSQFIIPFFLFGMLLNFSFLAYVFFKFRKQASYLTTIIKTVWWALAVSFVPFIFLSFVPKLLQSEPVVIPLYTSWFVLVFPISFAYLIMSKQLYDIDLVVRRVVFTTVIAAVPSALLTGIIAMIFSETASASHLLFSFMFTLILLSFVIYSLEYFATKLQPIMFPRKYHLQNALKKIAVDLQSISSFRELKEIVLVDIVNTLEVFGAAIVFQYNDRMETVLAGDISLEEAESLAAEAAESETESVLTRLDIIRHEEYASYLILTRKKTNTFLGMEEVQWLNLIISYLAVSLENMHLIGKLHLRLQSLAARLPNEQASQDFIWFRKLMFELQEAERKRIATDIHDTTLQDLFFLKKRFSSLMDTTNFSEEDQETMSNIIDYVEIINTNLRQSCFELHPHLLYEIGLLRTIQKVFEQEAAFCPFQLEFHAIGAEEAEAWDLDRKRHFFRIIQELLNNAKKHSQATKVSMKITIEDDMLLLFYEDDGVGFNLHKARDAELEIGTSGIGMEQMKSRVLYMDGQVDVRTSRGKGLQIWISLPIKGAVLA
ncbi:ATP-binding protein [Paenibacillus sp. H1-7]|uniref:ATP-binding protein n=1 Tax=Paenibacillus sp. H1-7 TaxID=2282849 RepID=UPI001EF816E0|nr:ATP-binding protein [Paenibacillus sp. H1-7]